MPYTALENLIIVIPEAAHEIRQRIAGIADPVVAKIEAAVVVEIVVEVLPYVREITAEFPLVPSVGPGEIIGQLKSGAVQLGWSLRRWTGREAGCVHDRRRRALGIVRIHVGEAESGGRSGGCGHALQSCVAIHSGTEFVELSGEIKCAST